MERKNIEEREITVKVKYDRKPLYLRVHAGSGEVGNTKFEIATVGASPYVNIKGGVGAVILDMESFVRAAIEILEGETKP